MSTNPRLLARVRIAVTFAVRRDAVDGFDPGGEHIEVTQVAPL